MGFPHPPAGGAHSLGLINRTNLNPFYYGRFLDGIIALRGVELIGPVDGADLVDYANAARDEDEEYDPAGLVSYDGTVVLYATDSISIIEEPDFSLATAVQQYESVVCTYMAWVSWQIALVLQVERWVTFGQHGGRPPN